MTSEAVTRHEAAGVVDPRSGEVVDLANAPHPDLVDVFLELAKREKAFKDWRAAVEDELVRRHGDRRAPQVVGGHEVDVDRGMSRVWDPEELEGILEYLIEEGRISERDAEPVIKSFAKVDGKEAVKLLGRLEGEALVELRRCFRWEQKGRAKVRITSVPGP